MFKCFYVSWIFVLVFIFIFPLAPVAAVHIPMPLPPAFINEEAGNLNWSKCVIICWLPDQLLLHPSKVDSCTSSLVFLKVDIVVQP